MAIRWVCPACGSGVNAPERPRKNDVRRYCLTCSAASGWLVERTAPSLERKRARKTAVAKERRQAQVQREREEREAAGWVEVVDAEGEAFSLDARALLREAWNSRALRNARSDHSRFAYMPLPRLTIRRGSPEGGRAALTRNRPGIRARDTISGHAKTHGDQIVLTIAPGGGHEWLRAIVVHEAAHMAVPHGRHGAAWRRAYLRAVRELYGVDDVPNEGAAWRLDEMVAESILRRFPR